MEVSGFDTVVAAGTDFALSAGEWPCVDIVISNSEGMQVSKCGYS